MGLRECFYSEWKVIRGFFEGYVRAVGFHPTKDPKLPNSIIAPLSSAPWEACDLWYPRYDD
ncbi:unnamed protein product [Prunus armeniaca]